MLKESHLPLHIRYDVFEMGQVCEVEEKEMKVPSDHWNHVTSTI